MPKKQVKRRLKHTKGFKTIMAGIWADNAIFCMVLGICSALAITNKVANAVAMSGGVIFCLVFSSFFISLLRNFIPARVRILTYMIVIATFVICVDRFLRAYFPPLSEALGPYVGLIITNCIIMGRCEAYAVKNTVFYSVLDGLGCGLGYSFMLLMMAVIRELLAFGTILDYKIMPGWWPNWSMMAMAPGAFFLLGIYLWILRTLANKTEE